MGSTISIIFRNLDASEERKLKISTQSKILDVRLNAQTLLGFDDQECQLILDKTGDHLSDNVLIANSNINDSDVILVIPSAFGSDSSSLSSSNQPVKSSFQSLGNQKKSLNAPITYKLILTIESSEAQSEPQTYEYLVYLQKYHENNPIHFFTSANNQEKQKLEYFLEQVLNRKPTDTETSELLETWCEEVALGYRETLWNFS